MNKTLTPFMTEFKRAIKLGCMILVLLVSVLAVQVPTVSAGVPSVTITTSLVMSHTMLNITVVHNAPPALSVSHYINKVELTITNTSGTSWVNFTSTLPAAPQNVTFYINYDMGPLLVNTSISVRAQCIIHGWSSAATGSAGPAAGAAPSAPQSLTATAGNGYVKLAWSAPTTTGSSAITNYTVYRGTSAGSLTSYKVLGNVTTYNDTAATNGNTYYYSVTATNGDGTSVKSSTVSAAPSAGGAPADNTMLIAGIVVIVLVLVVVVALAMKRKGGKEKPKE